MSLYTKIIDLQKLNIACNKVKKNKPAAGIDNVTFEEFDERKRADLRQLQIELQEHTYETLPVKEVVLYKGEKARTIALYSMRDKVIQQSIAAELCNMYESRFSECAYAYRSNKSALVAAEKIEEAIKTGEYGFFLKIDISHFFDTIRWEQLQNILEKSIAETDVIDLIRMNSKTAILDDTGELEEKSVGIHQGSGISPVLSNIYLMDFDKWVETADVFYVRYSDDVLILGKTKEQLIELLTEIRAHLQLKGLAINEKKTFIVSMVDGVDFLGYSFNSSGRGIPAKARENLNDRLEMMWLTSEDTFEDKLKKAIQIIGGWEQYFDEDKDIESIFEFIALFTSAQKNEEYRDELYVKRCRLVNIYKDIAIYLGNLWADYDRPEAELFEYEQFYHLASDSYPDYKESFRNELLSYYRKMLVVEDTDSMVEIMQLYTDLGQYEKASFWMEYKEKLDSKNKAKLVPLVAPVIESGKTDIVFNKATAGKLIKIFAGREDAYALDTLTYGAKRQVETQLLPFTEDVATEHLTGAKTVATYIQRPNSTVKAIVADVDISKKIMLQYERGSSQFEGYLAKARQLAFEIKKLYRNMGLDGYVEYSGCRGYHVWLLFTEWIPVRYANMFCDVVLAKLDLKDPDVTLEFFPNKTRVKDGKYGQSIKMPFGIHSKTGERSYFLDEDGSSIIDANAFLDGLARFQLPAIKQILAVNTGLKMGDKNLDIDFSVYGDISANVKAVLANCNLMKYLCQKSVLTGYLCHFERLTILYVFGHLGDDGKEFVHKVMSFTLNYQYNITQKFINRLPEKPISCVKLRDQYKNVTAEYGCSCNFKRSKNCYPSPVLHAIALSNDDSETVTVPTSRTLTKENTKKVISELNIHTRAQELATKVLELKKQKRGLDGSIQKLEKELSKIFDEEGIECLEIEMGLIVRKKTADGYEFGIEL